MTIKDFREKFGDQRMFEFMSQATDIWSNDVCMGYVIVALRELDYPEEEIKRITAALRDAFDQLTVDEAAQAYLKSPY